MLILSVNISLQEKFCKNKEFKYVLKETLLLSLRKFHEKTTFA